MKDLDFIRSHVELSYFAGSRILVTGASGFFGTWMGRALNGYCKLTLADRAGYLPSLRHEYDFIIHLAPVPIEPVIECADRNGALVLYASSGAVYGGMKRAVSESDETFPKSEYGKEKLASEFALKESGLDYRICRLFTFCGTGMRDLFAITAFVKAVKQHRPLILLGGGKSIRTYLHIADAVVWMLSILLHGHGTYNVGSERETSIRELALYIASETTPRAAIIEDPRPFVDPAPFYVPDCSRAHKLGLIQHLDLDYAIREMMRCEQ